MIAFRPLPESVMLRIVDKFLGELEGKLSARHVAFNATDRARSWLACKGYDPAYGARPLARLIDTEIKKPLSQELLFGSLTRGGGVLVDLDQTDMGLILRFCAGRGRTGSGGKQKPAQGQEAEKEQNAEDKDS